MNLKEIKEYVWWIKSAKEEWDKRLLTLNSEELVRKLYEEKKYSKIAELVRKWDIDINDCSTFELAFSLSEQGMYNESQQIYEFLYSKEPNNTSVLNNLYLIYKRKWEFSKGFTLIEKAYTLTKGNDDTIKWNYEVAIKEKEKNDEKEFLYKSAEQYISKETERALEKLQNFLINIKKEKDYQWWKIPIAKWKFKVLIWTDESKAQSLCNQWIEKGYIFKEWKYWSYQVQIYKINPYIENLIKANKPIKLNQNWSDGIENINIDTLNNLWYFQIIEKIKKIPKKYSKYQNILLRDFDELVINYIMWNKKTVIILWGSIIELAFTYYCEKSKYSILEYETPTGKKKKVQLLDATLFDFLSFFEEEGNLQQITMTIGNLARIYRNYIHPWNEIKSVWELDKSKIEICFNSAIECINSII